MDKVRLALQLIKKHHFWVLCGLAVLIALLCWTWATADLSSRFETSKGKLEGHLTEMRQILGDPGIRNEACVEATQAEHLEQKNQVLNGWQILYRQQKENNPLPAVLGEDFRRHFESLRSGQEMHARFRERYLNFIERHYPTLLRLVDIRRPADEPLDQYTEEIRGGAARGRTGGPGGYGEALGPRRTAPARPVRPGEAATEEPAPWLGVVEWTQPEIFDITVGWEQTPTTQQVLLAQEDLWVYEALLRIIKNVNEGVESHDKAWIKRINALEIGQPAAQAWGSLQQPIFAEPRAAVQSDAADPMGMSGPADGGPAPGAEPGMNTGAGFDEMGGAHGAVDRQDSGSLLDGRYVDENGLPLSAQVFTTQPPYAEFKMMMVHMDLFVHQRRIPKLLVECANSAMPIEVVRVRINPGQGGQTPLGEYGGGRGGMGGRTPVRPNPARPRGPRVIREGGAGGGVTAEEDDQDYVNVELFGIIYIYNPPDLAKLGTGTAATERQEEPAATEPPEPATTPVPDPTPAPPAGPAPVTPQPQPDQAPPPVPGVEPNSTPST